MNTTFLISALSAFVLLASGPAAAGDLRAVFDSGRETAGSATAVPNWIDELNRVHAEDGRLQVIAQRKAAEPATPDTFALVDLAPAYGQPSFNWTRRETTTTEITLGDNKADALFPLALPPIRSEISEALQIAHLLGSAGLADSRGLSARLSVQADCTDDASDCALEQWNQRIDALAPLPRADQAAAIQAMVNAFPYKEDQENWGRQDYWESPAEMVRYGGDCEDYASTKYWALRRLGVAAEDMRIVVVQDLTYHAPHAILALQLDGRTLILDNQAKDVADAATLTRYEPYYSVSEAGLWTYPTPTDVQPKTIPASGAAKPVVITFAAERSPTRWNAARGFSVSGW